MSNDKETKPEIKLNRKMRMWNKYKIFCIIAAVILVVVIVVVAAVKGITGGKNKQVAENPTPSQKQSQTYVPEATTAAGVTTAAEQTTKQEETTTTQAAPSGSGLKLSGSAEAVEFTKKDYYSDSVFMGDSVISGIESYGYLDNVVGNVNATSGKLESYVSEAMKSNPSKVFIMVGHNDANYGTIKEESLASNITDIVEEIHKKKSSTKVYVLSITPITSAYEKKSSTNVKQSYIDKANSLIEENASSGKYTYVDVASAYKDTNGYMKTDCTGNGINLKNSYYPFLLNGIAEAVK
ncbi:MAG: GDSL-type esterase/lipase family protein [Lachnospira sp.]|nr:GDSL-type esterase/lipase family protein [Lachnospira sp.]